MAARDLSERVPGLSLPSMGAGNTVSDPAGHVLAYSAPGSQSVNPIPTSLDHSPLPQVPGRRDRTVMLAADGSADGTPAQDYGAYRPAGGYEQVDAGGWHQV